MRRWDLGVGGAWLVNAWQRILLDSFAATARQNCIIHVAESADNSGRRSSRLKIGWRAWRHLQRSGSRSSVESDALALAGSRTEAAKCSPIPLRSRHSCVSRVSRKP